MPRLIRIEAASQGQIRALRELQGGDGTCTCGRVFSPMSPKFVLANFLTKHPTDKNLRECVVMAAYCFSCFKQIDGVLAALKNQALKIN